MKFKVLSGLVEEGERPKGTFVAVKFSEKSKDAIQKITEALQVPNKAPKSEYHVTVIYSRRYLPSFESQGEYEEPIKVKPKGLKILTGSDGNGKALVILLDSPELVKRHEYIMEEYNATHDWDEYIPHVTISYDCENFDPDKEKHKGIVGLLDELEIVREYDEELK